MNQKKLLRLLESNYTLIFLIMAVFAILTGRYQLWLGVAELVCVVLLYFYFYRRSQSRRKGVLQYIDSLTDSVDSASKSNLVNSPLPIMVFRPDTGEIIWSNENFLQLAGVREHVFEMRIEDAVPGFPIQWLLERKAECPDRVLLNGRRYRVYGSMVRSGGKDSRARMVATTYWVDTTEADALKERFTATRPILAIVTLDNYDELMKAGADTQRSAILAQIDERLSAWVADRGLLLKTERDRYLLLTQEEHYEDFTADRFSILDSIRSIRVGEGLSPTLSIGMAKDEDAVTELYKNAALSLEMALARGGDQAVVRNHVDFAYFGGRAKTTEKRTKVKSRVMANALSELMADSRGIYIMGHSFADMDCVGAEAGIYCAARAKGIRAKIVIDLQKNASHELLEELAQLPEYENAFLSPADAFLALQPGTLLVIVDTNRPEMVEHPELLAACNRVAVIDHHRRGTSYIENAAFSYHEPYASSASELVTELLQYMIEPSALTHAEAQALLAGMVLDTKHFTTRTGSRTFEAAAWLRRNGADIASVQKLFQNDLSGMVTRYDIMRRAEIYREGIAVACVPDDGVDRVSAAQASDELLTLKGVQASFVLYRQGADVLMSARSLGEVNVQVILEKLGGGGNSTTAGGKVENADIETLHGRLLEEIDAYFEK